MHSFALVTACALLAAPPPVGGRVGVVWHDQATVAHDVRQRLREVVADQAGVAADAILEDADTRARVAVTHRFSADLASDAALLDSVLTGAAASYRAGELDAAALALDQVEKRLRDDPGIAAASVLMGRAAVLRAQIAWTRGDDAAMEDALAVAVTLDPNGKLSTRRVQPAVAEAHERIRAAVGAAPQTWASFRVVGITDKVTLEVDGRPAPGPVPPGSHFVNVRRPGHPPVAVYARAGQTIELSESPPIIAVGLPRDRATAEAICEAIELDHIVLARQRGDRVGVQAYACGEGFAPAEFSDDLELDATVAAAWSDAPQARLSGRLHDDTPWPRVFAPTIATGTEPRPGEGQGPVDTVAPKPWFRRVWVWTLIGGAVAAGVTTGAVLGTRSSSRAIRVDWGSFESE